MSQFSFHAMGTTVQVVLSEPGIPAVHMDEVLNSVRYEIFQLEAMLSRFQPDSEVSIINRHPGQWIQVNLPTAELLVLAKEAFESTQGMFNPCLGAQLEQLGYDVSFELIDHGRQVKKRVFEAPYVPPVLCPYQVSREQLKVFLEPGYKIDLGGIAKGWIVKQVAFVLRQEGILQFLVSAGGDMICDGMNREIPWCVGVEDPFMPGNTVLTLDVQDLSIATSGVYRRTWTTDSRFMHHIIDPFLGAPTESDVISCTVVHPDIVEAEVLAKVALLLGASRGSQWLKQRGTQGWVMVNTTGQVTHSWI